MNYPAGKLQRIVIVLCCLLLYGCHAIPEKKETKVDTPASLPVPRQESNNVVSMLDKSPMDIIYFPWEYPKLKMMGKIKTQPVFRVIYSRPQKNGREVFGAIVKYGEPWRLGANEGTEIEFFEDVTIQETKVRKGRYLLYCIPRPTDWTLIMNSDLYSWGLRINAKKDVFKFTVPTMPTDKTIEAFTMETEKTKEGALLWMAWDDTKVSLAIKTMDQ
ncbi:MAG TPA: DUF2911 domain-containing protein [Agriterribacter sp.]|nr:DUF2911 domain-containing protein [Agriterribacter sp.]